MTRISAILFSRHCHRAIIFLFSATATCNTFLVRASGAVALKLAQVPSTEGMQDNSVFLTLSRYGMQYDPVFLTITGTVQYAI